MKSLKSFLEKRKKNRINNLNQWADTLYRLGFIKVTFPIILRDSVYFEVIYKLQDFAIDPDFYYHKFDSDTELIDCTGQLWSWKYDNISKTNLPGELIRTMTVDEVREIICNQFDNSEFGLDMKEKLAGISKVDSMLKLISS
jgi:hypothetical protein